ncbi:hypothetical protein J3R83DRAFT_12068 [Lanmaoa asiatica]|nr:hypothetical protein J3R83DRAFT_12068 [Lanmaoa asiatica]
MIVETDWPAVCDTRATQLSEPSIPVGTRGQITWTEDIAAVLNKYGSNGLGILYWEPGWIGNGALGSGCAVRSFLSLEPAEFLTTFVSIALG